MKKTQPVLILFFLVAMTGTVAAQPDPSLPPPGTTPDQVTYYGETVYEFVVGLALVPMNSKTEARYHAGLAGERVAEAQAVIDIGENEAAATAISRYPGHIRAAAKHAVSASVENQRYADQLLKEVQNTADRHRNMLAGVQSGMPQADQGEVKEALQAAENAVSATSDRLESSKTE